MLPVLLPQWFAWLRPALQAPLEDSAGELQLTAGLQVCGPGYIQSGAPRPNPVVAQKLKKLMTVAVALSLQKPEVNRYENTGTAAKSL